MRHAGAAKKRRRSDLVQEVQVVNGITNGKRVTSSDIVNLARVSVRPIERQSVYGVGHGNRGADHLT